MIVKFIKRILWLVIGYKVWQSTGVGPALLFLLLCCGVDFFALLYIDKLSIFSFQEGRGEEERQKAVDKLFEYQRNPLSPSKPFVTFSQIILGPILSLGIPFILGNFFIPGNIHSLSTKQQLINDRDESPAREQKSYNNKKKINEKKFLSSGLDVPLKISSPPQPENNLTINTKDAYMALRNGNLRGAINFFTKAISVKNSAEDKVYARLFRDRGSSYALLGEPEKALADYNKSIELNPDDSLSYYNRCNYYIKQGNPDSAINDCEKAIYLNPKDSEAFFNLGTAWMFKKNNKKAVEYFASAIGLNPGYIDAYYNRSITYLRMGEVTASVDDANKVIELAPNSYKANQMEDFLKSYEKYKK